MVQLAACSAVEGVTLVTVQEVAVPETALGRTSIFAEENSRSVKHLDVRDNSWRLDGHSVAASGETGMGALLEH